MMKIKTMIDDFFDLNMKFEKIFINANNQLSKKNPNNMFASAFLGLLNISTGHFRYVNAGHEPPLVYRKQTMEYEQLKLDAGVVLGVKYGFDYQVYETYLKEGERLGLYTDGVTERKNTAGVMYSLERLTDVLNDNKDLNIEDLSSKIRSDNDSFGINVDDNDDRTFLILEYRKKRETGK